MISRQVKIGGVLALSKIIIEGSYTIRGIEFKNFAEAIVYFLKQSGFDVEIKLYDKLLLVMAKKLN